MEKWSFQECDLIVDAYFLMLKKEILGEGYAKVDFVRQLIPNLKKRTKGSVEFKFQNVSAILLEIGAPYIAGYKPLSRYQKLLADSVNDYLVKRPEWQAIFERDAKSYPEKYLFNTSIDPWEEPPEPQTTKNGGPKNVRSPISINYLEMEMKNQSLGRSGEEFDMELERARIRLAGLPKLADQVELVSETVGPSAGYDIKSFELDGSPRYIETKTTKYGKSTPFFLTENELGFSVRNAPNYHLYRLFEFRENPKLFSLRGNLKDVCTLRPIQYRVIPYFI